MILVLCEEADAAAPWAADALRRRGLEAVVLAGAALAAAVGWRHTVRPTGEADCEVRPPGGGRLRTREVTGTLNRLAFLPRAWTARIGGPDRDYALQEMHALYLSWLHALPGRTLNPPTPQGFCGNMRHPSAWLALGARAGLPVRRYRQDQDDDPAAAWWAPPAAYGQHVIVAGAAVIGPDALAGPHGAACLRLASAAGCPLLGIEFEPDPARGWRMTGASVLPDLQQGGGPLADALALALAP